MTSFTLNCISENEVDKAFSKEPDVHTFFEDYRNAYEQALNSGNFDYVENYFEYRSTAYFEMRDYIMEIQSERYQFQFAENHLIDSTIEDNIAFVDTFEIFFFTNAEGITTKYERSKVYTIKLDPLGSHLISKIEIKNTNRN